VTGAFVGAAVVALLQYLRSRERRLILLMAMLLLQAFSMTREWWDIWKDVSQGAVCLVALVLALSYGPGRAPESPPDSPPQT